MTSCLNIELGTSVFNLIACGCRQFPLSNLSKTVCKVGLTRSYGSGNLVFLRRDIRSCKAVPTKSLKEISLVEGMDSQSSYTNLILDLFGSCDWYQSLIVIANLELGLLFCK